MMEIQRGIAWPDPTSTTSTISVIVASNGADAYFEIKDLYGRITYGTVLDAVRNKETQCG